MVKGYGTADGLMVLGEAPGAQEVVRGEPFVGQSGKILRAVLASAGAEPDDLYITNSVLCRPPGNATPGVDQIQACAERLVHEVGIVRPTKILTVGAVGLTAALHADRPVPITKWRGRGFWTTWGTTKIYTVATYHPAAVLRDPELFRDFARDVQKWLSNDRPQREPIVDELICKNEKQALEGIDLLLDSADNTIISCDLETTGKNSYEDTVMTWGFGTVYDWNRTLLDKSEGSDGMALILPNRVLDSSRVRRALLQLVKGDSFKGKLAFQNMKFDRKFLNYEYEEFLRLSNSVDTMLLSYILDERPASGRFKVHGLKAQARVRYDAEDYEINFDKFFKQSPEEQERQMPQVYSYQSLDLYYTCRLAYDLEKEVDAQPKLRKVVDQLLIPATQAFLEMEMRGVQLDIDYLNELKAKFEKEAAVELKWLQKAAAKSGFEDFNPLSTQQVQKLLYATWHLPKPRRSTTDRKELHDMVPKIKDPEKQEFVRRLIEYRLDTKNLKTYVVGLLDRAGSDGRIRSNFQLVGTVTGRLASQNPNLQNIPGRHGNTIRNAFVASPGCVFIEADYSQLEVRVAAALCGEEVWVEAFKSGRDLHKMVAAEMLHKPEDQVTEFERRIAKTVGFGILYGRGAKSLTEGQELKHLPEGQKWWNFKEAEEYLKRFMLQFPKLAVWMDDVKTKALKNHYVESPMGRRRRFPFIDRNAHEVKRQAGNMPIQSTASDICLTALIRLHNELPEGAYVLFSVHDAIYFECEQDLLPQVMKQIEQTMIGVVPSVLGFEPEVPFAVKIKTGKRWAEEPEL